MNKTKLQNLLSIGIGDSIGNALSAAFWFYIASVLEPEQYGEIFYFLGIAGLVAAASLIGTQNTIVVYTAKKINIHSTLYFLSLIFGVISSIVIIFLFYRVDVVVLLFGYIINTLAIGELLGRRKYTSYSKHVLIQKGLTLVLGIGFYFIFGPEGIIYALALTYVHFSFIIIKSFNGIRTGFRLVKGRIGFIMNNYILTLVGRSTGHVDKLIIAPLLGFALLGNYGLALQVVSLLIIPSQIFYKYILPEESKGNIQTKLKLIALVISIGLAVLGYFLSPWFITSFFPKFTEVLDAIQIMSFWVIPGTIVILYQTTFLAQEKSRFVLIGNIISLSIIVSGMIILGQYFGMVGLAITYVLSFSVEAVFCFIVNRKYMDKT